MEVNNILFEWHTEVEERYDRFVFTTVKSFCEEVTQQTIPKIVLVRALTNYLKEHKDEYDLIMAQMEADESSSTE